MPWVAGFLRPLKRRPRPDQGLPDPEEDMTPDWGIEEGDTPPPRPVPTPPPGIWPPPTIGHPIVPLPPDMGGGDTPPPRPQPTPPPGTPGHLPVIPPGAMWPPIDGPVKGLFVALVHIPGYGWKYVVIDPDAWQPPPEWRPEVDPTRR